MYVSDHLEADWQWYYESLRTIPERGDPAPWINLFLTSSETVARAEKDHRSP